MRQESGQVAEAEPRSELRVEVQGTGSIGLPVVEIKSKGRQRAHEFDFEGELQQTLDMCFFFCLFGAWYFACFRFGVCES